MGGDFTNSRLQLQDKPPYPGASTKSSEYELFQIYHRLLSVIITQYINQQTEIFEVVTPADAYVLTYQVSQEALP